MKVTKITVPAYKCGECGRVWRDKPRAEKCCKPYKCLVCGKETPRFITICSECAEKHEKKDA